MTLKKIKGRSQVKREMHEIDAAGQVVGRLATRIAILLQGKHKPDFEPHIDHGDFVKVKNVDKIVFTGKKWQQKVHYRTSGRPGGLKRKLVSELRAEKPAEILRHAVKYMLPKNRQQIARLKRLTIT
jgi:large subunit ribosomal protein L13